MIISEYECYSPELHDHL